MLRLIERLVGVVLLFTFPLTVPPMAWSQSGQGLGPGIRGVLGESITATSVSVRQLPGVTTPAGGTITEILRGEVPGGRAAFETWKKAQPSVHVGQNVTIDPSALQSPSPLAASLGVNFEGTTQQGYIPGEPQPAVGPNEVLVIGNVSIVIANKDGSGRTEVLQSTFLNIPSTEGPGFDAKCFYDALRGRFVLLAETQGSSGRTKWCNYYLAVSQTSSAQGSWWIYKFDMTKDGTTQTNNWSDFPGLGVSEDKLVMSGQQFSFGTNLYQYQKLRIIDRSLAYSGGTVTYVDFANFSAPPGGTVSNLFVTKPGRNVSRDSTIHVFTTRYDGGSNVAYRMITGPPTAPVLSSGVLVSVNPYGAAVNAVQLGTTNQLDGGDCRTPDFFVRNGILHIAWHFGNNFGSGTVDAIRYLRLRTSDQTVLTDETFGADGIYYYYPMVCVDSVGTMFMGFCRSSSSEYSSSWVTGKRRSDASIEPSTLAKAGVTGNGQSRWGDFTGIDMDETSSSSSGSVAWYSGLWAKGSSTFGTWVNQMTFTYGTISGQVLLDADGDSTTTGDRTPLSGWVLTLRQGSSTISTARTNASGAYNFGFLETGTYDVVVTVNGGYYALATALGSGGTSQTKINKTTIEVNLTNGQSSSGNTFLASQRSVASIKAFLEGPYSSGSMTTSINGILPLSSPYSAAPRTVASIPSTNVVDWVEVELRQTATGTAVASKSFFLRNDGMVIDSSNTDTNLEFNVAPGNYYMVVRHRNHLAVMSATAVALSSGSATLYDFTTAQTQAYGTNPMIQVSTGVYAMIGGDGNGDGGIDATDRNTVWKPANGTSGYFNGDFNLDGGVDAIDLNTIWRPNNGSGTQVP